MRVVKLCTNKILQFLTVGADNSVGGVLYSVYLFTFTFIMAVKRVVGRLAGCVVEIFSSQMSQQGDRRYRTPSMAADALW